MASQSQNGSQPRFLGRYELMYLLGQGGMGEVHLARLTGAAGFEKLCIVKTILPQMMTDPQFVDRFHHEAKVLTHLTHSNIAQVYDMGDVDETLYMAIEYVAGVDLSRIEDRVKGMNASVPVAIAVLIGQQITEALGYAHRKVGADGQALGIVHRDVSPQNVMVSYEGEVKVIDFGLAKSTARSKHTMPSTVLGKLGYMSPEQAKGETVDHRSDIYSAGIVVWELIAGRPLFQGGTVGEMVAQMAFPKAVSLRTIRPEVSEILDRAVMKALSPDPANRYNRADDFSRALNELLVRENLSVSSEDVGNYVRSMCPEEFAAERHLQSKLSSERKKGSSSPKVGSQAAPQPRPPSSAASPASHQAHAIDGTMVRTPAAEVPLTGPQRALSGSLGSAQGLAGSKATPRPASQTPQKPPSSPMQPRESFVGNDDLTIQKSKAPLYAVLGLLVVGAAGAGGYWYANRDQAVVVEPPPKTNEKAVEVAKVEPEKKDEPVAEVKKDEPVAEVKKDEPVVEDRKIERGDIKGETLATFRDKGDLWVKPGKKTKVKAGDELMVVGPPIPGTTQREIYGTGAIMEMKGQFGRVDEGVEVPKDVKVVFAVIEKGVDTRAKAAKAVVRESRPGPLAAKIEKTEKVERGVEPNPFPKPEATAQPAKTEPKADARPVEAVQPGATQEPARAAQLVLKGRLTNEGRRGVVLYNDTHFKWNTCDVRLPFKKFFRFEDPIHPMSNDNIRHGNFEDDPREPDQHMKQGWALVRCREASGYIWWGKKMEL